jgi:hypothetical protein
MFSRLPTLKNWMSGAGGLAGLAFLGVGVCSCDSTRGAKTDLQTALHTRPAGHRFFDANAITNAIHGFGTDDKAAFAVLKQASNETNALVQNRRITDTNNFVRAGALFGMGQLGKSVPEVEPFLWEIVYSPSRKGLDRSMAFGALKMKGFQTQDIPALAKLLASPASDQNILTKVVPETVSSLIESNPPAAKPYLASVENLLDDSNPDTQFRAALALVKSEGGDNPKVSSALHALFQRPDDRQSEYYKDIAAQILGEAGPAAKSLVPDLVAFAKSPDEDYVYQCIARIEPGLGSQIPEVAQALKDQQRAQMWTEKWQSGSYTLDDLRSALKEEDQALLAAKHLAGMGAAAKIAVPDLIQAMWGKDEDTRNAILADIHTIDPRVIVTKIDLNQERVNTAFSFAHQALEKMPASKENKALTDSCFRMLFMAGWALPEELAAYTNHLAVQAPDAYRAYVEGLKPSTCAKPAVQPPQVWGGH